MLRVAIDSGCGVIEWMWRLVEGWTCLRVTVRAWLGWAGLVVVVVGLGFVELALELVCFAWCLVTSGAT